MHPARLVLAAVLAMLAVSPVVAVAGTVHGHGGSAYGNTTKIVLIPPVNGTPRYWVPEPWPPWILPPPWKPVPHHPVAWGLVVTAVKALESARGLVPQQAEKQYDNALSSLKTLLAALEKYREGKATRADVAAAALRALEDLGTLREALLATGPSPYAAALLARVEFARTAVMNVFCQMLYWALPAPRPVPLSPATRFYAI